MRDNSRRAKWIFCERIGNPGFLGQIVSAKREHAGVDIGTGDSDKERVERLGQNHALSAFGDSEIGIGGKNNK